MTGKQLSFAIAAPPVVHGTRHGRRPAILSLIMRLLPPTDRVGSRLRAARASLDAAMRFSPPARPSQLSADRDAA